MGRSAHHAQNVSGVALTLLGAILWRADDASLEAFGSSGPAGNVLWVKIGGKRYAFSYDHNSGEIMMKQGSTQGVVLHRFDNSTPSTAIEAIFRVL
jgi:hypothetical protein